MTIRVAINVPPHLLALVPVRASPIVSDPCADDSHSVSRGAKSSPSCALESRDLP